MSYLNNTNSTVCGICETMKISSEIIIIMIRIVSSTKKYYFWVIYEWFIINIPLRMALIASGFADFFTIINRYFFITNKTNCITRTSAITTFFIYIIVSIALYVPGMFAFGITSPDVNGMSTWYIEKIGYNTYYITYVLVLFIFDTIAPPIVLSILGFMSLKKFRLALDLKAKVSSQSNSQTRRKQENRFTKLTIILTSACVIYRTIDCLTGVVLRIGNFVFINYSLETMAIIGVSRDISLFIIVAAHTFDNFIIFKMDSNLNLILKKLFRFKHVRN